MQTVAVVGYARRGHRRRSARRRRRVRSVVRVHPARRASTSTGCAATERARAFLDGAGPAAIGAILGSAIPLARALDEPWQFAVLAAAAALLLALRRGVVVTLLLAAGAGVAIALAGGPLPA